MPIAVNLLKDRRVLSEKEYQREKKYLRYAVTGLAVVGVLLIATGIWYLILTNKLGKIEREIGVATQKMEGLTTASAQQVYLKSRLKLITDFLTDRSLERESLQHVFGLEIPGVTVTNVAFEEDDTLAIQLSAEDLKALGAVVDYFQEETGFFVQVVSQGVNRGPEGDYTMRVLLTIPRSS